MRYPDTMSGKIPAEAYSLEDAKKVTDLAEEVISEVEKEYIK